MASMLLYRRRSSLSCSLADNRPYSSFRASMSLSVSIFWASRFSASISLAAMDASCSRRDFVSYSSCSLRVFRRTASALMLLCTSANSLRSASAPCSSVLAILRLSSKSALSCASFSFDSIRNCLSCASDSLFLSSFSSISCTRIANSNLPLSRSSLDFCNSLCCFR